MLFPWLEGSYFKVGPKGRILGFLFKPRKIGTWLLGGLISRKGRCNWENLGRKELSKERKERRGLRRF